MVMVTVQIMELTSADSLRINAVQRSYSTVAECSMLCSGILIWGVYRLIHVLEFNVLEQGLES